MPLARLLGLPRFLSRKLLYKPEHSLIDQSLHARLGVDTTNGDGFGVGWYGSGSRNPRPSSAPSSRPGTTETCARSQATSSRPLFLAHIRASTGTAVQQTNCHPFRYGRWIWVHNGLVRDFHLTEARPRACRRRVAVRLKSRDLRTRRYFSTWRSRSACRTILQERSRRMVGFVEEVGHRHGTQHPIQMTIGTTDGNDVWAFRYSSEGNSRTLYYSSDVRALRELYPDRDAPAGDLGRVAAHRLGAAWRSPRSVERGARI